MQYTHVTFCCNGGDKYIKMSVSDTILHAFHYSHIPKITKMHQSFFLTLYFSSTYFRFGLYCTIKCLLVLHIFRKIQPHIHLMITAFFLTFQASSRYCDQICTNTNGSYVCNCQDGYELQEDKRSCKAHNVPISEKATLVFANSVDIRHINLDGSNATPNPVPTHETLALDFLHRNRSLCWISHQQQANNDASDMKCAKIDNLSESWNMPQPDMYSFKTVNQIAVDWASNNWYFLDDTREIIQLCSFKRQKFLCKTILSVHLSKPRGIALDPNEGMMFFTIWGSDPSSLNRASLDGEDRSVLVDSKIVYPYGLTLDFPMKRIYWVDTYLDYIEAIDYDGSNRKTILRGSPAQNLYSASVFENNLYLTSWRNNSILRVNKFKSEDHGTVLDGLERPFAIQVFHRQRQPLKRSTEKEAAAVVDSTHPCIALNPCDHVRTICLSKLTLPLTYFLCVLYFSLIYML